MQVAIGRRSRRFRCHLLKQYQWAGHRIFQLEFRSDIYNYTDQLTAEYNKFLLKDYVGGNKEGDN